jgi:hypothetical protein
VAGVARRFDLIRQLKQADYDAHLIGLVIHALLSLCIVVRCRIIYRHLIAGLGLYAVFIMISCRTGLSIADAIR